MAETSGSLGEGHRGNPVAVEGPWSWVGAVTRRFRWAVLRPNTTGVAPGAPAIDGDFFGLSQAAGSLFASAGSVGATGAADGSGGSRDTAAGAGTLPETSTERLASESGAGFPILPLLLGLLAGGLVARRQSGRSAS